MKSVITLFLTLFAGCIFAQQTEVCGKVVAEDGEGMFGVNILIDQTYEGTSTDVNGKFCFKTLQTGTQKIIVQMLGYESVKKQVECNGQRLELEIVLKEKAVDVQAISVEYSLVSQSDDRQKTTVLRPLEVMTTGGSNADITNALRTMPGAQAIGEKEGLFVRGGTGNETRIYIDGLPVENFYYEGSSDIAQRGRFAPELFEGTFFSSGGYSALYGQALSSVLVLNSIDMPDKSTLDVQVGSVGGGARGQWVDKSQKKAFGASLDYTNLSTYYQLVPQNREFTIAPNYLDASLYYRQRTSSMGSIKAFASFGKNELGTYRSNIDYPGYQDYYELDSRNYYSNLTVREYLGKSVRLDAGVSFEQSAGKRQYRIEEGTGEWWLSRNVDNIYRSVYTRGLLTWKWGKHSELKWGGDVHYRRMEFLGQSVNRDRNQATYLENDWRISRKWMLRTGIRAEYNTVPDRTYVVPRLHLSYMPRPKKKEQITFSYGQFIQTPETEFANIPGIDFEKSTHYILGYQRKIKQRMIRLEVFNKEYDQLVYTRKDTNNIGSGYARGIELFFRDKQSIKNSEYWISYSFLDTKRQFRDYPILTQPDFAADHTATVVFKTFVPRIALSVGGTYTIASGRPYFNPNQPENRYLSDRTEAFQNLGLTVAKLGKIKDAYMTYVATVSNLLGNTQVFGYRYSSLDPTIREAVKPMARRFFYVGVFVNWGFDKRQQQIDQLY